MDKVEQEPGSKINRRDVLKLGVRAAALAAVAGTIGLGAKGNKRPESVPEAIPESIRDEILTANELKANHITINPTQDVQFYLRRSALGQFEAFKDAREGKLKEVVITLVDAESLSWNAMQGVPDGPRLAWQSRHLHPSEEPESFWEKKVKDTQQGRNYWKFVFESASFDLESVTSGAAEEKYRLELAQAERALGDPGVSDKTASQDYRKFLLIKLEAVRDGTAKKGLEEAIAKASEMLSMQTERLEMLGDRAKAIEAELGLGVGVGEYIKVDAQTVKTRAEWEAQNTDFLKRSGSILSGHPELFEKVFIYVCVGGRQEPDPSDSFISPDRYVETDGFAEDPQKVKDEGKYRFSGPNTTGTVARHELFHIAKEGFGSPEYDADTGGFESIAAAWRKYQKTGDTKGYSLIFVTKKGATITKRPQQPSGFEPVV